MEIIQPIWRKSRRSGVNGECVELARMAGGVAVRDSKALPGPMLRFRPDAWRTFLTEVRDGRFDVA
jgi:hypothetical protein